MTSETTRLYISPFSPALQQVILNPTQRASAYNLCFHSVQTFPEKSFGYLDIDIESAQKLRRKFNGSTFKGMKLRVEEARPEKRKLQGAPESIPVPFRRSRVTKPEDGVLPGIELPLHRSIKRGWTSDQSIVKDSKTSGEQSQLVFRTNLPANVASKATNGMNIKPKKKSRHARGTEVVEFSNTLRHPKFLRDSTIPKNSKGTSEYVEGMGWIDEDGNIIEAARKQRRTSGRSIAKESERATESLKDQTSQTLKNDELFINKWSSQVSPSSSQSSRPDKFLAEAESGESLQGESTDISSPSRRYQKGRSSTTPEILMTQADDEPHVIHPLESIFKRPAPTSNPKSAAPSGLAPIDTSFNFFDEDAKMDEGGFLSMPHTPFTRRDIEGRRIRSAAPTPDTAAIGKRFTVPWKRRSLSVEERGEDRDLGEEDEGDEDDEGLAGTEVERTREIHDKTTFGGEEKEKSEWEKHFWEHRGEYNRSWKSRRRERRKEIRQSVNRKSTR